MQALIANSRRFDIGLETFPQDEKKKTIMKQLSETCFFLSHKTRNSKDFCTGQSCATPRRSETSVMDILLRDMGQCHLKCKKINLILITVQSLQEHLEKYKTVPKLESGTGCMMPFCFHIGVKEEAPLFVKYGVKAVSVSFPPDSRTLEILLIEEAGRKDDMPFTDVKRFGTVGELMLTLDKIADGDVEEHYPDLHCGLP